MNIERLREFYERAGYRVTTTPGASWYAPGHRVYRNFPCGATAAPSPEDVATLCRDRGVIGVEIGNDRGVGVPTGVWTLRDRAYDARHVQRQFRQHLARALERETVHEVAFDELFREGAAANRQTLARHASDSHHLADPQRWRMLCDAGRQTPGAVAFATVGPDGLSAYLVGFVVGATCYGLVSHSIDAARHAGSNHALFFSYAKTMISRPGIAAVTLGLQALPPIPSLDQIKRHAGFRLEPFHLALVLRPAYRALLESPAAALALRGGARVFGAHPALRRAEALRQMIRATADGERANLHLSG